MADTLVRTPDAAHDQRMRLVVLALLVLTATAEARVIQLPAVVNSCRTNRSFPAAVACMKKVGKPVLVKTFGGARVYRMDDARGYLFVTQRDKVVIGGMFYGLDGGARVTDVRRVTFAKHAGYRIDMTSARDEAILLDGVSTPAVIRTTSQAYCSGVGYRCSEVTLACDAIVRGRTLFTFRGTPSYDAKNLTLKILGDRSHAGEVCAQEAEVYLAWDEPRFPDGE